LVLAYAEASVSILIGEFREGDTMTQQHEPIAMIPVEPEETGISQASIQRTQQQLALLEELVHSVLKPDQDFGIIPGTDRPTLLKPGAANIIAAFNCHSEPHVDIETIDPDDGFVNYTAHVDVVSNLTGKVVSRGFGSCNSYEKKYRYREEKRKCPHCQAQAIIKGRAEYGGGWLCWGKQGGCGAKFPDGDPSIEGQTTGQIDNPDPLDQANTCLKIAIKRAEVDAALRLPGVAHFFTQDLEDIMGDAAPVPQSAQNRPSRRPAKTVAGPTDTDEEPPFEPEPSQGPAANPVSFIAQRVKQYNTDVAVGIRKGQMLGQDILTRYIAKQYGICPEDSLGLKDRLLLMSEEQVLDLASRIAKGLVK
jgi:hypothetical protein